jgi:hypothetical protein
MGGERKERKDKIGHITEEEKSDLGDDAVFWAKLQTKPVKHPKRSVGIKGKKDYPDAGNSSSVGRNVHKKR